MESSDLCVPCHSRNSWTIVIEAHQKIKYHPVALVNQKRCILPADNHPGMRTSTRRSHDQHNTFVYGISPKNDWHMNDDESSDCNVKGKNKIKNHQELEATLCQKERFARPQIARAFKRVVLGMNRTIRHHSTTFLQEKEPVRNSGVTCFVFWHSQCPRSELHTSENFSISTSMPIPVYDHCSTLDTRWPDPLC